MNFNPKRILLTNDDGYTAVGMHMLACALSQCGYSVTIMAPSEDKSGTGHSMTMNKPLHVIKISPQTFDLPDDVEMYSLTSTPTDCVAVANYVLPKFDLVISGINFGPNLGDDITYSGTFCAALEGYLQEIPSFAISLVASSISDSQHYETAVKVAIDFIEFLKTRDNFYFLYNINVPNLPLSEIKGVLATTQGIRRYEDAVHVISKTESDMWVTLGGKPFDIHSPTFDVTAVDKGYVSVTPVQRDMTNTNEFEKLREYFKRKD